MHANDIVGIVVVIVAVCKGIVRHPYFELVMRKMNWREHECAE